MKKHMKLFDLVAMTINTIIGMGIFLTPSSLLSQVHIGGFSLFSLALAFVFTLFISYSYMLLGSTLQRTGGEYIYISRFLEPFFGFIAIWMLNLSVLMFLVAQVKLLSSSIYSMLHPYLSTLTVHLDTYTISTLLILFFTVIALSGNRGNVKAMNLLFLLLLFSLTSVIVLLGVETSSLSTLRENFMVENVSMWEIIRGAFLLMWLYFGFNIGVNVGEEIKGGKRNIAKGIILSLIIVFAIYLLLEIFILSSFSVKDIVSYPDIVSLFASHHLSLLAKVANVGFTIVLLTKIPSLLILLSRRFYAWGRDKILPEVFGAINQRRGVPWFSIVFSAFLAIVFLSLDLNTMDFVFISTLCVAITFFLMNLSALILKYKRKRSYQRAAFKLKHDTFILIFASILSLSLLYNMAAINLLFLLFSLIWLTIGAGIYILRRDIHLIRDVIREEIEKLGEIASPREKILNSKCNS